MISKSAKKEFLARILDDFDWVKQATSKELDVELNRLNPVPKFHTPPYIHQKACFLVGLYVPEFLFLLDMGLGKTKLVLDLLRYQIVKRDITTALILVPNLINIEGWVRECNIHAPGLAYSALIGSSHERETALLDVADVYILNYAGLVALVTLPKGGKGKGKRKRIIQWGLVAKLAEKFDAVVFDESDALANHRSLTFKICSKLSKSCVVKYDLTGVPFGRDPMDLWAQFYAIDRGATLGNTLGMFRECFFTTKINYWGGYEYTFNRKMENKLYEVLKNRSLYYKDTECQDLPKQVFTDVIVSFPVDTYQYYKKVLEELIASKGNYQLMQNVFVRMRQIASGFMRYRDDDGEKCDIEFEDNPKLDALKQLVEQLPSECKMIIYHEFIRTGKEIAKLLDSIGVGYERLWSGTKDKAAVYNSFLDDSRKVVFVLNNNSGSKGLNLQVANYVVWVEAPVSPKTRKQGIKRPHRPGQKHNTVFYFDIMMKNSIDFKIRKFHKEGGDLFKMLIEGDGNGHKETKVQSAPS